MTDLLLTDAAEVVTYADHERFERTEDAAVAVDDGRVVAVGPTAAVTDDYPESDADAVVDCAGRAVVPGFVDPHTHALFAGDRSDEFEAKLRGQTYQEILEAGGGILRTVEAVRAASTDELVANLRDELDVMLAHGTTTAEVKSGYGLDAETELRMLDAIDRAAAEHPVRVVPTFMGAHAVPTGRDADDYVEEVVTEQIPAVAEQGVAAFCDVFCEEGVFDVAQSRRVLEAGIEHGLTPKVHAEELSHLGGTQLAAEVGAASADHLLHATDEDVDALVAADVTPVLLPGTAFGLGAAYADAEAFLDRGAPLALATDLNPNCYSQSMPFAMTLGCVEMGLTPAQALGAATANAARAVDRPDAGRLEPGSPADLAVLDAPSHVHLSYNFGVNPVDTVVVGGEVAHE
ncbi:imidazolonepropionase [Halogeometricum rufum]|uniref:Imidazolonepropionase n=1 Tax=Halogeometricum rufum TaxID=553469 RepID=A0A1I6HEE4_9EURY|nr:imidazolonepropionase [Halogeometricum rufum]SFR52862.1 imidazolonepropionase [Halogeometricum rufum]